MKAIDRSKMKMVIALFVAAIVLGWSPVSARADTVYNWTNETGNETIFIGATTVSGSTVPRVCIRSAGGVEHAYAMALSDRLTANVVFNLTASFSQTVVFIRDGANEPDANHDCGYTAAQWGELNFNGYSVTINAGSGSSGNFFETPDTAGNVVINGGSGVDRFRIWYHAGSYYGNGGADEFISEWNGDSSSGESMYGGTAYDTICDHNNVGAALCGGTWSDSGQTNFTTQPYDCNAYISSCSFPGSNPTIY